MQGKTRIQFDKDTLNILLGEFASNDTTKVRYENGNFVVDKAGLNVKLTQLPLKDTKLEIKRNSKLVSVALAGFFLEENQVSLDIDVKLD